LSGTETAVPHRLKVEVAASHPGDTSASMLGDDVVNVCAGGTSPTLEASLPSGAGGRDRGLDYDSVPAGLELPDLRLSTKRPSCREPTDSGSMRGAVRSWTAPSSICGSSFPRAALISSRRSGLSPSCGPPRTTSISSPTDFRRWGKSRRAERRSRQRID
jgi:hypothetical protein